MVAINTLNINALWQQLVHYNMVPTLNTMVFFRGLVHAKMQTPICLFPFTGSIHMLLCIMSN